MCWFISGSRRHGLQSTCNTGAMPYCEGDFVWKSETFFFCFVIWQFERLLTSQAFFLLRKEPRVQLNFLDACLPECSKKLLCRCSPPGVAPGSRGSIWTFIYVAGKGPHPILYYLIVGLGPSWFWVDLFVCISFVQRNTFSWKTWRRWGCFFFGGRKAPEKLEVSVFT